MNWLESEVVKRGFNLIENVANSFTTVTSGIGELLQRQSEIIDINIELYKENKQLKQTIQILRRRIARLDPENEYDVNVEIN